MEVRPGYKKTQVGNIPDEWKTCRLWEISHKITDGDHVTPRREPFGHYLLSARNILNGVIDVSDVDYVGDAEYFRMRRRCAPEAGDILISCSGTIGRVTVVPPSFECVLVRSAALVKVDNAKVDSSYIQYWLQDEHAQGQISNSVNQGAQPNLFLNHIERLQCPLPSLSEQRAIAAALLDTDALLGRLDRLIAKKRDLKQAAMQRLLHVRTRLPGFGGEWKMKRLGEVVELSKVGINPSSSPSTLFTHFSLPAFDANEVPVVEAGASIGSNKFLVSANAVLLSKLNPRIPRVWAPVEIPPNSVCSTEFMVLVPKSNFDRMFLKYLCLSSVVSGEMELHAIGTTGSHQRIQPTQAMAIQIAIPIDLSEQIAIADILSDMDAELTALKSRRNKTRALKQAMMRELLTGRTRLV